jgi:hypothetical protein
MLDLLLSLSLCGVVTELFSSGSGTTRVFDSTFDSTFN